MGRPGTPALRLWISTHPDPLPQAPRDMRVLLPGGDRRPEPRSNAPVIHGTPATKNNNNTTFILKSITPLTGSQGLSLSNVTGYVRTCSCVVRVRARVSCVCCALCVFYGLTKTGAAHLYKQLRSSSRGLRVCSWVLLDAPADTI